MSSKSSPNYLNIAVIGFLVFFSGIFVGSKLEADTNMNIEFADPVVAERPASFSNIDLSLFWLVWDEIKQNYVFEDKLDSETMTYGAIKGLVESLDDPFNGFLDPNEAEQFKTSLNAELEGIGAELSIEDDLLRIVSPLKDSPAEKAGIQPGDIIYRIEGELAADFSLFEAVQLIRGPKGTNVTITLVRDGIDEPFDVTIQRGRIELESVTYENLGDGLGLISINQFSDDTLSEFLSAVRQSILDNSKGIIIDLRYNGGGYLEISVDILGELLEKGKRAVKIESRTEKYQQTFDANGKARLAKLPMVVLINEGSASASEIVAGALQDHDKAHIIGTNSFGKGTVQEVLDFPDGSSLRLTIARWLTPNNRDINEEGIKPDEIIEFTPEDAEADRDPQLERAQEYLKEELNK